jgi:hypothetical protein
MQNLFSREQAKLERNIKVFATGSSKSFTKNSSTKDGYCIDAKCTVKNVGLCFT